MARVSWKSVRGTFLVLSGATSSVPCLQYLVSPEWWPPGAALFRVAATLVAAGALGIVLLCAGLVRRLRIRRVAAGCAAVLLLALALLFWYDATLRRAVHRFQWQDSPVVPVIIPLNVPGWIDDELVDVVRDLPGRDRRTRETVTDGDVEAALRTFGPAEVMPHLPSAARTRTVALLVAQYSAAVTLITVAFGVLGLRVGWVPGEVPEPEKEKSGDEGDGDGSAAQPPRRTPRRRTKRPAAADGKPPRPRRAPARRRTRGTAAGHEDDDGGTEP